MNKDKCESMESDALEMLALSGSEYKIMKWISVKDRLPEPNTGETFLIFIKDGDIQTSWYETDDKDFFKPEFDYSEVTYWMSLPKPPKIKRGNK